MRTPTCSPAPTASEVHRVVDVPTTAAGRDERRRAGLDRPQSTFKTGAWRLDPAALTAQFSVRNFGVRRVTGTVPLLAGAVEVDDPGGGPAPRPNTWRTGRST